MHVFQTYKRRKTDELQCLKKTGKFYHNEFARHRFFLLLSLTVHGQDWPRWRGPDGNGIVSDSRWNPRSLNRSPEILWQANVGIGYSSLAVKGDYVYTMGNASNSDTVYCLDFDSGEIIWRFSYPCSLGSHPGPRATPAVEGGRMYTISREGHLFCLDAYKGDVVWKVHLREDFGISPPSWGFAGSVVISGDFLLLNAGDSGMAVDKNSGEAVWSTGKAPGGYATPVLYNYSGKKYAAMFGSNTVNGVDIGNGRVDWSYGWGPRNGVNAADPVVSDGKIFVSSAYGFGAGVIDFSGRRPELVWKNDIFESHFSSFIYKDGYLYGNDGDARQTTSGIFRCIEFETGREKWNARLGFGSLIAVGDYLIMLNAVGVVVIAELNPEVFRRVAEFELPRNQYWTPPVLVRGRLFIRNLKGDVFCIDAE